MPLFLKCDYSLNASFAQSSCLDFIPSHLFPLLILTFETSNPPLTPLPTMAASLLRPLIPSPSKVPSVKVREVVGDALALFETGLLLRVLRSLRIGTTGPVDC